MIELIHIHMHTEIDPTKLQLWQINHHKPIKSSTQDTYNVGIRLHNFKEGRQYCFMIPINPILN